MPMHVIDGPIRDRIGVVEVARQCVGINRNFILHEMSGTVVAAATGEGAPVHIESAVDRPPAGTVHVCDQMPLAEHRGVIAGTAENLRHGQAATVQRARVALRLIVVGENPDADLVWV
jgi:hypothetical protein